MIVVLFAIIISLPLQEYKLCKKRDFIPCSPNVFLEPKTLANIRHPINRYEMHKLLNTINV
jgi:hypothetical protein